MSTTMNTSTISGLNPGLNPGMAVRPVRRGAPASPYRRVERARVARRPNYIMRRWVAGVAALVFVGTMAVLVHGVLASFGGRPAAAAEARPAQVAATVSTHVARPGDSLWSIAAAHRGNVGLERYVDDLIRLNGGTVIVVGQAVVLP